MSTTLELGKLVSVHPGLGAQEPLTFNDFASVDADTSLSTNDVEPLPAMDNKTIADKAVADTAEAPSIWFVNFPSAQAAEQKELLATYMQNVLSYRCWSSLVWYTTVYESKKITNADTPEGKAARTAFAAKVAAKHMKLTPWLAVNRDINVNKRIECFTREFHTKLITDVLEGFVSVTPSVLVTLEKILLALAKSNGQSSGNSETKTIVCERYEYLKEANAIRSYVRLISFSVSDSMKEVNNAKKTEKRVTCNIEYNEYEAVFNHDAWLDIAKEKAEETKKASKAFVEKFTIDCDP
ncbi:uncharacterized protein RCO7_11521 [Rhynchosporium graminicola]|uniref:Uncharacterized protein n=1 Tax=Rhynchosporium graminicola TaxID=2792576 RepID=A0A1E1KY14_9HELO|nr:uncharacterized protein RCO7_11521 [Rhynchosporium commune]